MEKANTEKTNRDKANTEKVVSMQSNSSEVLLDNLVTFELSGYIKQHLKESLSLIIHKI